MRVGFGIRIVGLALSFFRSWGLEGNGYCGVFGYRVFDFVFRWEEFIRFSLEYGVFREIFIFYVM